LKTLQQAAGNLRPKGYPSHSDSLAVAVQTPLRSKPAMWKRIKQYIWIAIAGVCAYFLLSYHFVFNGWTDVTLLKKAHLSFNQTFVNIKPGEFRGPEDILRIDVLREDGIGDILVEKGHLTDEERWELETYYESEQ
jgi:hypothetical protein